MLMRYQSLWRALRAFPSPSQCHHSSGYSSTPAAAAAVGVTPNTNVVDSSSTENNNTIPKASEISKKSSGDVSKTKSIQSSQKLISAAFVSLKQVDLDDCGVVDDLIDSKITDADTVESLLSLSQMEGVKRNHALKIVSKLADWTAENKIKLSEFEGDVRFIKLCNTLGHQVTSKQPNKKSTLSKSGADMMASGVFTDLGVVLGVAGDDEAAKLVDTITVPQMIKVLSSLAYKKRRSIPLLRSLAFNIGKSSDELNIKDCADILYACAMLSFQDEVLFEKVCSDLCNSIHDNNKPAVVGSIITSLGLLRYKDKDLLDTISEWVIKNFKVCRIQDLTSLVLTLAAVDHIPVNGDDLFKKLETHLQQSDVSTPSTWLDVVWALVILNKANTTHLSSVLSKEFIEKLASSFQDGLSVVSKLKLLNVNGAAQLLVDKYPGPLLESDSEIVSVEVPRGKEKQLLVAAVIDTLSNLLPSAVYMNVNIYTGMGYIIDGECVVDSNLTPLPLIDKKTGQPIDRSQPGVRKGTKVAIMVLDYHDITRGTPNPVGIASLAIRLTQRKGYRVITVPYHDFNPRDKLVQRVQYLEQQLKNVVKNNFKDSSMITPLSSAPSSLTKSS